MQTKYKIKVDNISCTNCARTITNGLTSLDPNSQVKVNINTKMVFIITDKPIEEVYAKLKEIRYPATETNEKKNSDKFEITLAIILSIPLFLGMLNHLDTFEPYIPDIVMNHLLQFTLATIIQFYAGRRFYLGAYHSLKQKVVGMDFLVSFSTSIAYFYSIYLILTYSSHELYFEVSALVITIVLIGKSIEAKTQKQTIKTLEALSSLSQKPMRLVNGEMIDSEFANVEDRFIVYANETISRDGIIIEGETYVDESNFTGESEPVIKKVGDEVLGGSINLSSEILVEIDRPFEENVLNQIIDNIEQATMTETRYQQIADKIAGIFVPIVIFIAFLTVVIVYFMTNDPTLSIERAMTVIVISCPCSLGLATPTSIMVSNGIGLKEGILYKGSNFFESAHRLNVICFDKTGTLTVGKPQVIDYEIANDYDDVVSSLHQQSVHPIAKSVANLLSNAKQIKNLEVENITGLGMRGQADGHIYEVGNRRMFKELNLDLDFIDDLEAQGKSVNLFVVDQQLIGYYTIRDEIKQDAKKLINEIKKMGIQPIMITGDNEKTAALIADKLGIDRVYASCMPEDKHKIVKEIQDEGKFVGFVGDGVNDSVALTQADVAITVHGGNDIASSTSDAIMMQDDLMLIISGITLAKLTRRNIIMNFAWAFSYNIVAIPLAIFGFTNMFFAAIFMGFSSIVVVLNALYLRVSFKKAKQKRMD